MTATKIRRVLLSLVIAGSAFPAFSQPRRGAPAAPKVDIENYVIQATLKPESHEIKATAQITFRPLTSTDVVLFNISENLSVQRVLNAQGVEVEFAQDEAGPGIITVRFQKPLAAGQDSILKIEYSGGFDRDRFSRNFTRDEGSAYIGMEGSYLLYSSKWFPVSGFPVDRAAGTVEVTVPLGQTVIGPGTQLPVVTRGVNEVFSWSTKQQTLPNSIVVGQYFERQVKTDDFQINCFAGQERLDAAEKNAKELGKILRYYQKTFGPSATGNTFRLVEVEDKLVGQPGMLGTIFITRRELTGARPAIRELARRAAYQWWADTVGVQNTEDLWLVDGMSYYSAALFLADSGGPEAMREETDRLAVLALKFENRSPIRGAYSLGYRTEQYDSVVGGKGAWVVHMVRELLGNSKFSEALQQYIKQYSGTGGTTAGFRGIVEKAYGKEMAWFFGQWLDTTGIPNLTTDYVTYRTTSGFKVMGSIKQDRDMFRLPLDIQVRGQDNKQEQRSVEIDGKTSTFEIETPTLPTQVVLDPENRVLRDSKEMQIRVQIALGDDLKERGDFIEAIRAYENALKLNARKSMAHFRLAEVFFEQMNLNSAANTFRDALNGDKDPKWLEVWCYIYLGKINDILGQRQRALAEYNKAVNTKDDTNGAQAEVQKWIQTPFTRETAVKSAVTGDH